MAPHTIILAVGAVCRCKAKAGMRRSHTIVITVEIECGFVAKVDLVPFRCSPVSSCATPLQTEASRKARVMGAAIPNVLQPAAFVWFEKTQGLLMKVLPVPGLRPMKQLAVRVHFLRCGGLLDDWSVKGVLSLIFM
ncbi:e3 ubiquitin-protein ligase RNF13 [Trichonephila clavipes]|nr:e3 ubiquitin-protein ligase RNF13 [Trichonephila clavipes]